MQFTIPCRANTVVWKSAVGDSKLAFVYFSFYIATFPLATLFGLAQWGTALESSTVKKNYFPSQLGYPLEGLSLILTVVLAVVVAGGVLHLGER